MKIYIATDHNGLEVENVIIEYLKKSGIETERSVIPHNEKDDYVDFAVDVSKKVVKDNNSFGILICGTGIGMSIAANKIKGIRASRCVSKEDAYLTRTDNNANILCISNKLDENTVYDIVKTFIETPFSSQERHIRRVNKIIELEKGN